jgi:hypothetical protein
MAIDEGDADSGEDGNDVIEADDVHSSSAIVESLKSVVNTSTIVVDTVVTNDEAFQVVDVSLVVAVAAAVVVIVIVVMRLSDAAVKRYSDRFKTSVV